VISFKTSEEQDVIRDALHEFADQAMRPLARDCDEESKIPEEFLAQAWELGLVNTQLPAEWGGGGEDRSPVTNAILYEELAWGDATLAIAALSPAAFAFAIADQGSDAQKKRYLPLFCSESYHAASLAINEPSPTFDPRAPQTSAQRNGEGYLLNGRKCFVPMGDRASHFLVTTQFSGETGDRLEAFIVPRDAAGLSISGVEKNLGLRGLPTTTLELENVEVSAGQRLGEAAGSDVQRIIDHARVGLAAVLVGVARASLEYAVPYAKDRQAFDQAIAQKQGIAFKLADMHIETESARWLVWKAASQLEKGQDATRSAHFARNYAAEKGMWVVDQGIQVLGGHGFIREHPVEMWYRNGRTLGVLEGTLGL
jgi:alkylation response protein AidB-like acyl-CoA dehydrogenase